MSKKFMDKMKEGVSIREMEDFARKYTTEVFSAVAIAFAAISSMFDFFTGPTPSILFLAVATILSIFCPIPSERGLKQFYNFVSKQEKTTQLILGCVQVLLGLFLPFLIFAGIGLLAGTSYHYYTRQAQIIRENRPARRSRQSDGDEHD